MKQKEWVKVGFKKFMSQPLQDGVTKAFAYGMDGALPNGWHRDKKGRAVFMEVRKNGKAKDAFGKD